MTEKKRMPPLTMDEVMLLVDTYYKVQEVSFSERLILEKELSDAMRSLPLFPELRIMDSFRSCSGMNRLINALIYGDFKKASSYHISEKERNVLAYYGQRKELLNKYAKVIKQLAKKSFPILSEFSAHIGGSLIPSYHVFLEKNDDTIKRTLQEALSQHRSTCHVCGTDLEEVYGTHSSKVLEIHIALPFEENNVHLAPSPSELVLICPTCHKIAHADPQNYDTKNLQSMIRKRSSYV